jgi:hypothetical protein
MAICLVVAQSKNPSRLRTPAFGRKVLVSEKLTIEAALRREARWCVFSICTINVPRCQAPALLAGYYPRSRRGNG